MDHTSPPGYGLATHNGKLDSKGGNRLTPGFFYEEELWSWDGGGLAGARNKNNLK